MNPLKACVISLATALLLAGCDSTAPAPPRRLANANADLDVFFGSGSSGFQTGASPTNAKPVQNGSGGLLPGTDDPSLNWADPCAANLDQINGALLIYYGLHKEMPPTLDDIPKLSPDGTHISLTCPVSGKRYVYYPRGLRPPVMLDQNGKLHPGTLLILYDADASHDMIQHLTDGQKDYDVKKKVHFGIVMDPPTGAPQQAVQTYVVPIEENLLNMYLKNADQGGPVIRPVPRGW